MKPGQDAIPAEAGEEDEFFKCFDDITGKKLSWHAANEARAKELKFLRELGVYEKVDERAAVGKYNVTPVDTEWVNTVRGFEEKPGRRSVAKQEEKATNTEVEKNSINMSVNRCPARCAF